MSKYNVDVMTPYALPFLSDPRPPYVPLADVAFGPSQVVLPMTLPPQSQAFRAPWFNKMLNIPSPRVIYDSDRNGIAF